MVCGHTLDALPMAATSARVCLCSAQERLMLILILPPQNSVTGIIFSMYNVGTMIGAFFAAPCTYNHIPFTSSYVINLTLFQGSLRSPCRHVHGWIDHLHRDCSHCHFRSCQPIYCRSIHSRFWYLLHDVRGSVLCRRNCSPAMARQVHRVLHL